MCLQFGKYLQDSQFLNIAFAGVQTILHGMLQMQQAIGIFPYRYLTQHGSTGGAYSATFAFKMTIADNSIGSNFKRHMNAITATGIMAFTAMGS